MPDEEHVEQEPEVFAVEIDTDGVRLSRRHFVELAAASAATAMMITGCSEGKSPTSPPTPTPAQSHKSPSPTPTPSHSSASPTPKPTHASPKPKPTKPPGTPGTVPPGHTGVQYRTGSRTYTLPCGSPIPPGAVCTCNCVSVPPSCSCVGYQACSCVGHQACSCVGYQACSCVGHQACSVVTHYWYPN